MRIIGLVLCLVASTAQASEPSKLYGRRIVAPKDLSADAQAAVADLQHYLKRMTGGEFERSDICGEAGIVMARASEEGVPVGAIAALRERSSQAFCIWPDGARLWLVSASDQGLSHAASFYLERLGVRWYAPTERWTIVPRRDDLRIAEPIVQSPAFTCRYFFGTGGFGGNLPCDPKRSLQATWAAWQRRNRFGGEFAFSGHTGEAFNTKHRQLLEAHPEYLAEIDGKRVPWSLTAKWCSSNDEVLKLYVEDRLSALRLQRQLDPSGPRSRIVSVEPADGGGHCTCAACLKIGTASDRVFRVANTVAQAVRAEVPDALVSVLAYNEHAAVPSIDLNDNVFVLAVPYGFQRTDLSPEQLLEAWGHKAKRLGLYDYWSIPDWTLDQPKFDFLEQGPAKLRFWQQAGVDAFLNESTYSTGAMGPAWYTATRLAWNPQLNEQKLFDEYCRDCFGPAAEPMARMLRRWTNGYWATSHELGLSFRDVDEAWRLAAEVPECAGRVADMGRYVEYLRLRLEYQQAPYRTEEQYQAALKLIDYGWSIYDSTMIHAFRLSQLFAREESARHPEILARYDGKNPQAPGWTALKPISDAEVSERIFAGIKSFEPQAFTARRYSEAYVPLAKQTSRPEQEFSPVFIPSSSQTLVVSAASRNDRLTLRVAAEREMRVTVFDDENDAVFNQRIEGHANWQTEWSELGVAFPLPGVYRVQIWSPKRTFRFSFSNNLPVSLDGWVNSQGRPTPRLYFFVPRTIERAAIYTSYLAAGPPRFLDPTGAEVKPTMIDGGKLTLLDIPPSQRGAIWSLDKAKCPNEPLRMLNVPGLFAFDPLSLLVPRDALE
jgi:hypothetical protein